ncbi:MAG TPA: AAA family ATPase [Chloroflexota bacterium]
MARDREVGRIMAHLSAVTTGDGRLVLLAGEAGIGKTRLAREVMDRAQSQGAQMATGRCFEQQMAVPFFPFTELLERALASAPPRLQGVTQQRWPELALLMPDFRPRKSLRLESQNTQLRFFRAVTGFLGELAITHPLVVLLEDLHWADTTSLDLLLFLCRYLENKRILTIGSYRDDEVDQEHQFELTRRELIRERVVDEVRLQRLDSTGTSALIGAYLGADTVPDDLIGVVHQRASGNPFFTEELVAALVENGSVVATRDRVRTRMIAEVDVPRNIRSVVSKRVRRLPVKSQQVLRLASLLGDEFELNALVAASDSPQAEVLDGLDPALQARLIKERYDTDTSVTFDHALIRQTLYEEIPLHRRQPMHLSIGEALAHMATVRPAMAADVSRHFLLGGDRGRAASYALMAGDFASARYAHGDAAKHYQAAMDLLVGEPGKIAHAQRLLAGELHDLNRSVEALESYTSALATFEQLGDPEGQALAHWGIARLYLGRYDVATATVHADAALGLWPSDRQDEQFVRMLFDAARVATLGGDPEKGTCLSERALALARESGDSTLVARAVSSLSVAQMQAGADLRSLDPMLEYALGLAGQARDWGSLHHLHLGRGNNRWLRGDLDGAIADRRLAVDAAQRSGETERLMFAYAILATTLMQVGEWRDGRAAAESCLELDPEQTLTMTHAHVFLAWMDGRSEDARRDFKAYVDRMRARANLQGVSMGLVWNALLNLQLDRAVDAHSTAREALAVARTGWRMALGPALAVTAEAAARLDADDTDVILAEAERYADGFGIELVLPQLRRARAIRLARRGLHSHAVECLESSATTARSQHAVLELAQTLQVMSTVARDQGDDSRARAADQERLFIVEQLGPAAQAFAWGHGLARLARKEPARRADGSLTAREHQVAALIVAGLSNRQIADSLVISERTVENHVSNILSRLHLETRAQVAVWGVQHGMAASE